MKKMVRFGVTLEAGLQEKLDDFIKTAKYRNRSAAIRDAIRRLLSSTEFTTLNKNYIANISLIVFANSDVFADILKIKKKFKSLIVSTCEFPSESEYWGVVITLHGNGTSIKNFANQICGCKGVVNSNVAVMAPESPCKK